MIPRRPLVAAALAVGVFAVLLASPGCSVRATLGSDDGGAPSASSGGPSSSPTPDPGSSSSSGASGAVPEACDACLHDSCASQEAACDADPECRAIYVCATAPGCDRACGDACYTAHPGGQPAYDALSACDQLAACGVCRATCAAYAAECAPDDAGAGDATASGD